MTFSSSPFHRHGDPTTWANLKAISREEAMQEVSRRPERFYIYVLCKPDGTPFYVGKGQSRRAFQHEADAWNTSLVSHKLNVIRHIRQSGGALRYAIADFLDDEATAHARERALIALIGRHDQKRGPLTNQIDGGEGASNPSAESQARQAASLGGEAADPERRVANSFLAGIAGKQDSVPIKPWSVIRSRAHLLRPSPGKPTPQPTERMAKALAASAIANAVLITPGAVIPRRLSIEGVECVIENGCGGDMIHAGLVEPVEPRKSPLEENLRLTTTGFWALKRFIGADKLIDFGILDA